MAVVHNPTRFHVNRLRNDRVILLTGGQTIKQTATITITVPPWRGGNYDVFHTRASNFYSTTVASSRQRPVFSRLNASRCRPAAVNAEPICTVPES